MSKDKSGIKYFFMAFAVTAVVLAIVFVPIYLTVIPMAGMNSTETEVESKAEKPSKISYTPNKNDRLNILIGLTDDTDRLITVYLCRLYPQKQSIPATSLPVETLFQSNDELITLEHQYSQNGMLGLCDAVSGMLNIEVDKYAKISKNDFISIVNYIGSIEYFIPENLVYENKEQNIYINIPKGIQNLDGERLYTLITFPQFSDTLFKHKLYTDIISSYINLRLDEWYMNNIDSVFAFIVNNSESNISVIDHAQYKKPFLYTITSGNNVGVGVFLNFDEVENGVRISKESFDMIDVYFK